jgi:hypothetical protein
MKYIKEYKKIESEEVYIPDFFVSKIRDVDRYIDEFLYVYKIKGFAKGKIIFKLYNKDAREADQKWSTFSMLSGCAQILDTKYENKPEIRNITLGSAKFRKVMPNTIDRVFFDFLKDLGYNRNSNPLVIKELKVEYQEKLKQIPKAAINLGDVLDELKKIRELIREKWILLIDMVKYNL